MLLGISGLIAGYVLLAILLLSLNLYSHWSWWIKAIAIVITTAFYLLSYFSFPPLFGWPTEQKLPAYFKLLATTVHDPNKLTQEDGAIFLWVQDLRNGVDYSLPRAYQLVYSKGLHSLVIKAQTKIDQGVEQLGEYDEGDPIDVSIKNTNKFGKESLKIQFYNLPDAFMLDKDAG